MIIVVLVEPAQSPAAKILATAKQAQPTLALPIGGEGTRAVRFSAMFGCGGGVGRRAVPIAAAQLADDLADVAVLLATGQLVVNEFVNDADEAVQLSAHYGTCFRVILLADIVQTQSHGR